MRTRGHILAPVSLILNLFIISTTCLGYNYENTGLSARVLGLGYTFTGITDDPTTIYWNPAGIARVGGGSFTSSNPYNIPGYNVTNLSISYPLKVKLFGSTPGFGLLYSTDIGTITDGINTGESGEKRLGLGFGIAKGSVSFGGTFWVSQLIAGDYENSEQSIDLGFLWHYEDLKTGVTVRNFNALAPLETTIGASYRLPTKKINFVQDLMVALDMTNCNYDGQSDFNWNAGLEATLSSGMTLRFGTDNMKPLASFGLGFNKGLWFLDYAYMLHELANTHYLSVGYKL